MKREKPEKIHKNPDIVHHNCPPGDTETRTRDPSETDERSKHFYAAPGRPGRMEAKITKLHTVNICPSTEVIDPGFWREDSRECGGSGLRASCCAHVLVYN